MSDELFAVLNPNPLLFLVEDAGAEVAGDFFRTYLQMLPLRTAKIVRALLAEDQEVALDAVLSLKSTSRMVGALRLAALCAELEAQMRDGTVRCWTAEARLVEQELLILEYAGSRASLPAAIH